MRKVLWMALALMGGTSTVALAQQQSMTSQGMLNPAQQPAGSPSGAISIQQGQDPNSGPFGLQPSGGIYGLQPSTGNIGIQYPAFDAIPYQGSLQPGSNGLGTGGSGTSGLGTSGQGSSGTLVGPTYQGTTPIAPGSSTQVNPNTGTNAGTGTNPTLQSPTTSSPGTGINTGTIQPGTLQPMQPGTGTSSQTTGVGGQSSSLDDVGALRQRVASLEREVDQMRGTGGSGAVATSAQTTQPTIAPFGVSEPASVTITNVPGADAATLKSASQASGSHVVASAVFDGRVSKVTSKHIDIIDSSDGSFYRLSLDKGTKVFRGSRLNRISARQLSEGTTVRASFQLNDSGDQTAEYIVARPHKTRSSK